MKRTARIDALRNIRKRFVSWLSIVTIILIGTSIILGLYFARSSTRASGMKLLEGQNFKDLDLACSIGIKEQELEKVRTIRGVKDVEGALSFPGLVSFNGKNAGTTLISATERISVPCAVEGRLPETSFECALFSVLADNLGVSIGDEIGITVSSARLENILINYKYKVTGIAVSPDYMSLERGDFCILNKNAFDTSSCAFDFTNLYVEADIPDNYDPLGKKYAQKIQEVSAEINGYIDEMSTDRMKTLADDLDSEYAAAEEEALSQLSEGKGKIEAAQKEFDEKISEAQKQISDGEKGILEGKETAEKELSAGAKKIHDGENEYNTKVADGEKQLADAEKKMEKELNDAKWKLFDGFLQLDQAEKLLNEKEEEYKQGEERLARAKKELSEGWAKYNEITSQIDEKVDDDTISELISLLEEVTVEIAIVEQAIADLKACRGKETLERCQGLLAAYDNASSFIDPEKKARFEDKVGITKVREQLQELADGKKKLDDGQRQYDDGVEQLKEARQLLDQGWYSLEQGKKELAAGEAELAKKEPEARKQLADAKAEFERQKADGARQLEDAKKTYASKKQEVLEQIAKYEKELEDAKTQFSTQKEKGEKDLADAWKKYDDAEAEAMAKLNDARTQIEDAKKTPCRWFVQTRQANFCYIDFYSNIDVLGKLFMVFTPLYAIVVVIVCLFTMAIIVEEQSKQTGTCKALGMYKSEIRSKYLLFGVSAAILGAILGMGGAYAIERIVCNSVATIFAFGPITHNARILPIILMPVAAAFITAIAVYWSSERILSCSAVGLVSGSEPVKRSRKKAARNRKGSVYTRLIFNNFIMDLGRETVSVVVVVVCIVLIGFATSIKLGHSQALDNQINNILSYNILLSMTETATDEEKDSITGAIEKYDHISVGKLGAVIQTEDGQTLTEVYVVDDAERFKEFYSLRDISNHEIDLSEDGMMTSIEMMIKDKLYDGRKVTLVTGGLRMVEVEVNGHFLLHAGRSVIMTSDYYRKVFDSEPDLNTFLIKTGDGDTDAICNELLEYPGVSGISRPADIRISKAGLIKLYTAVVYIVIVFSIILSFMILLNLSNILVAHRMKELLTMRVNGFAHSQVIGYLVRELVATTSLGLLLGLAIGIPVTSISMPAVEAQGFMYLRMVYVLAWVLAVFCNTLFAVVINAVAFRKIKKVPLTDITKY